MSNRHSKSIIVCAALTASYLVAASPSRAADEDLPPTVYVNVTGGYSVYKSAMAESNDTGITTAYGFGVNAGANHNIGMFLARESTTIAFALNGSSIAVAWQDVGLRYWLGPVSFGLLVSSSTWAAKEPPRVGGKIDAKGTAVDYIDLMSTGYGANIGSRLPIGKRSSLFVDATYVATGVVQQKGAGTTASSAEQTAAQRVSTLGPRTEFNLGGSLGLGRSFSLVGGFKYRTYNVTVDGTAYKEQLNTTYVGLDMHWWF